MSAPDTDLDLQEWARKIVDAARANSSAAMGLVEQLAAILAARNVMAKARPPAPLPSSRYSIPWRHD